MSTPDANCSDGDVRLVRNGEVIRFEGRVEVCMNNAWGTVSSRNFDTLEIRVICRQLGFSRGGTCGILDFLELNIIVFISSYSTTKGVSQGYRSCFLIGT